MIITEDSYSSSPVVVIFTDYNLLANNTAIRLKNNGYRIVIVTTDEQNWTNHEHSNFEIRKTLYVWDNEYEEVDNILVMIFDPENIQDYLVSSQILAEKSGAKLLIVTNYSKDKNFFDIFNININKVISNQNTFAGILYLANIFEKTEIYKNIIDSVDSGELTIDPKKNYFLTKRDVADHMIVKYLLSLSVYGSSAAVTSMPISSKTIFRSVLKFNPEIKVYYERTSDTYNASVVEKEIVEFSVDNEVADLIGMGRKTFSFSESKVDIPQFSAYKKADSNREVYEKNLIDSTTSRLSSSSRMKTSSRPDYKPGLYESLKKNIDLRNKKLKFRRFFFIALIVFLFPYLIFFLSMFINKSGDIFSRRGNTKVAINAYGISKDFAYVSKEYSRYFSYIPVVGIPYERSLKYQTVLERDSQVSNKSLILMDQVASLFQQSFNNKINNIDEISNPIALEMDSLYKDLGLLKTDINSASGFSSKIVNFIVGNVPDDRKMSLFFYYKEALLTIPEILGSEQPKDYALLMVDNRIKRPSGGVIEAVAVATFSKGNLTNIFFYDTAELDTELQGFATPPALLSENSKIEEYYLRDALWSPDYPTSAKEIEWFLEKQLQKKVDGVLMFDFNFLSKLIDSTGPVVIDNQRVDGTGLLNALKLGSSNPLHSDNYFKEIFTVGINRIIEMNVGELRLFFSDLSSLLNSKNSLININVIPQQIENVAFNNSLPGRKCNFDNCLNDFIAVSELEFSKGVGINKQLELKISFEEGVVKRDLIIYYKNQQGVVDTRKYDSNLIISIPQETSVSPVKEIENDQNEDLIPLLFGNKGFKQVVVNAVIEPGAVKAYQFGWESGSDLDFAKEGQYEFKILKQPGESEYSIDVTIIPPRDTLIYNDNFDLTRDGTLHYNTQLSEDINLIFNW